MSISTLERKETSSEKNNKTSSGGESKLPTHKARNSYDLSWFVQRERNPQAKFELLMNPRFDLKKGAYIIPCANERCDLFHGKAA